MLFHGPWNGCHVHIVREKTFSFCADRPGRLFDAGQVTQRFRCRRDGRTSQIPLRESCLKCAKDFARKPWKELCCEQAVCRVRCRCPPKPGMAAAAATSCRSQLFAACEHRLPRSDHRSFDARRVPPEQISRKRLFSHVIASSRRHHANSCRKLIAIAKRWATRRELWGRLLGQDRRDQ